MLWQWLGEGFCGCFAFFEAGGRHFAQNQQDYINNRPQKCVELFGLYYKSVFKSLTGVTPVNFQYSISTMPPLKHLQPLLQLRLFHI